MAKRLLRRLIGDRRKWIVPPLFLLFFLLLHAFGVTCIWKHLFGVICPGCGFTRSLVAALRLDLAAAWRFHPMFWSAPLLGVFFLRDGKLTGRPRLDTGILIALTAGFLLAWILRLASGVTL